MCEAWPGPRCSHDMDKKVKAREAALAKVEAAYGKDSPKYALALARLEYAQQEWNATPDGITKLKDRVKKFDNEFTRADLFKAEQARQLQTNAAKEIKTGRLNAFAVLFEDQTGFYEHAEVASVIEASREYQERFAVRDRKVITEQSAEAYSSFLNSIEERLEKRGKLDASKKQVLAQLREMPAPDSINAAAYAYIPTGMARSKDQLKDEIGRLADIQGVSDNVAATYYEAYRQQYLDEFAGKEETERPDPPESWVRGEGDFAGYTKDFNTNFAPRDDASLYAIYRLRSDQNAIPQHFKTERTIASIDLETAGPTGKPGMEPKNGHIIEVGIIVITPSGKEISRYSQLVRPDQKFLDLHGTGAEDVHHISVQDLNGKPDWNQIAPRVAKILEGKVVLGHNVPYEKKWLTNKLEGFDSDRKVAFLDTRDYGQKHQDLPNFRLKTVSHANNVEYGDGAHRAEYDAERTVQVYLQQQRYIKKTWNSKLARRNAPALNDVAPGSRWDLYRPRTAPRYLG
jgi:DNA polymerase III epsilon subunit-like protein